ncbi:MAG: endonuclease/exonuclease/phosphatase family protein [Pseudoxanthomonas sp.]
MFPSRSFDPRPALLLALCLALLGASAGLHARPAAGDGLRVMSFNVRYAAADDGINAWEKRRGLTAKTVLLRHPDILGTQELLLRQARYLQAALPGYAWFGKGRNGDEVDDNDNEHMGVFYNTKRLKLLEHGDFWYSDTPDVPGSSNFGQSMPRMATWARFRDLRSGRRFYFFDTHFPHRPEAAPLRVRCARLLLARIARLAADEPVIVTGDFNSGPDTDAHRLLTATLRDAWESAPRRTGPERTVHAFTGTPTERIDWVLFRSLEIAGMETVTDHAGALYPSDHFAVVADLAWPSPPTATAPGP